MHCVTVSSCMYHKIPMIHVDTTFWLPSGVLFCVLSVRHKSPLVNVLMGVHIIRLVGWGPGEGTLSLRSLVLLLPYGMSSFKEGCGCKNRSARLEWTFYSANLTVNFGVHTELLVTGNVSATHLEWLRPVQSVSRKCAWICTYIVEGIGSHKHPKKSMTVFLQKNPPNSIPPKNITSGWL